MKVKSSTLSTQETIKVLSTHCRYDDVKSFLEGAGINFAVKDNGETILLSITGDGKLVKQRVITSSFKRLISRNPHAFVINFLSKFGVRIHSLHRVTKTLNGNNPESFSELVLGDRYCANLMFDKSVSPYIFKSLLEDNPVAAALFTHAANTFGLEDDFFVDHCPVTAIKVGKAVSYLEENNLTPTYGHANLAYKKAERA